MVNLLDKTFQHTIKYILFFIYMAILLFYFYKSNRTRAFPHTLILIHIVFYVWESFFMWDINKFNHLEFDFSCLNFWDKAWWFLSFWVFRYCLHGYIHNVSADASSDFLHVLLVKLRSLHRTSNHLLYLIWGLSIPVLLLACNQDWTCNLQMIVT